MSNIYLSVSIRKEGLGQQYTNHTAVALSLVQTVVSISQNSSISNSNLSRLIRNHVYPVCFEIIRSIMNPCVQEWPFSLHVNAFFQAANLSLALSEDHLFAHRVSSFWSAQKSHLFLYLLFHVASAGKSVSSSISSPRICLTWFNDSACRICSNFT